MEKRDWIQRRPCCPYYLRHGAGRIVCRGYGQAQRVALEFDRPGRLLEYYQAHCRSGQEACPQRKILETCRRGS